MPTRVRIEPAFRVVGVDDDIELFGRTAREALERARDMVGPLRVTTPQLIDAVGWSTAYTADDVLIRVLDLTGGEVIEDPQ